MKIKLLATLAALLTGAGMFNAVAQQWSTNTLPSGLIAWWPAEGNMLDSAGSHDGTGSATPAYGPGRFGQAFRFNGTDQSVMIPDGHADLDGWTQFTLEAWVNFDSTQDSPGPGQCVISKVGNHRGPYSGNFGYQFGFGYTATKLFCQFNSDTVLWPGYQTIADIPFTVSTNMWYHVAATYDHNAVKLYLNGVPLVTNVVGPVTIADTVATLRISKDDNDNVAFAGRIDDARIYNRALSAAEIAYLYTGPVPPVTNGLKLHLDASNVNGDGSNPAAGALVNIWRDLSGLGLDLTPPTFPGNTVCVAPVYRTNALNGRAGVDFGVASSAALATAFTSQLDFTNCTMFMVGNGAGQSTHVSISAPCVTQEFALASKGIWHHSSPYHWVLLSHQDAPADYYLQAGLFGVHSGDLVNFLDGVASTSAFILGQQSPTLNDIADYVPVARQAILGWRNSDAYCNAPITVEHFTGTICEVLVYDRQLNLAEVDAMNAYLAGKYNLAITRIPPTLTIVLNAPLSILTVSWPAPADGWVLERTNALPVAGVLWPQVPPPYQTNAGTISVSFTNLPATGNQFFRLHQP